MVLPKKFEQLGLFSLAKCWLRWDMFAVYKYIMKLNAKQGELLKLNDNAGTRTNGQEWAINI